MYDTSSAFLGETVHLALILKDDATKPVGDESLTSDEHDEGLVYHSQIIIY